MSKSKKRATKPGKARNMGKHIGNIFYKQIGLIRKRLERTNKMAAHRFMGNYNPKVFRSAFSKKTLRIFFSNFSSDESSFRAVREALYLAID